MDPSNPHDSVYREALTMTQAAIVAGQFANGFGCRTERQSVFKIGLLSNRFLVISEFIGVGIMLAISYVPFIADIFKTGPLTLGDWGFLVIAAVTLFFAEEGRKWLLRRKDARAAQIAVTATGRESAS